MPQKEASGSACLKILTWSEMTMQQRSRSMRLFAIIKSTFANHGRTATLINAFLAGISPASSSVDVNSGVQTSNGFELIRQLTLEYSIRTRNEALTFGTALAKPDIRTLSLRDEPFKRSYRHNS